MNPRIIVPLLVAAALAGCLGSDDPIQTVTVESTTQDGLTVTLTAEAPNATVGQVLNFTLDATATATPAGNATDGNATASFSDAQWTLTFEQVVPNGTDANATAAGYAEGVGLPAVLGIVFEVNGTYTLTAVVNATGYETGTVSLTMDAHDAVAEVEEVVEEVVEETGPEPWHWEGSSSGPCLHCPLFYSVCVGLNAGMNGQDCVWADLPDGSAGRTAVLTSSTGSVSWDWMSSCPEGDGLDYGSGEPSPQQHKVPQGTGCVMFYTDAPTGATFTIDLL